MNELTNWIWVNREVSYEKKLCLFRRRLYLDTVPGSFKIQVSADSSYKLYVNGCFVSYGPCKGDLYCRYFDVIDIGEYLKSGNNVLAVAVIYFPNEYLGNVKYLTGAVSIVSSSRAGFILAESEENDAYFGISTDEKWKVKEAIGYKFTEAKIAKYAGDMEHVEGEEYPSQWETSTYNDENWHLPEIICNSAISNRGGVLNHWCLKEREIPLLYMKDICFSRVMNASQYHSKWENLIKGDEVHIPANSHVWVELDVGELTTAFIEIMLEGGAKSELQIIYAESYTMGFNDENDLIKDVRDDNKNGMLVGEKDEYVTSGSEEKYEPFFYRVFRFIRLEIKTSVTPLSVKGIRLRETGYPLVIEGEWKAEENKWQALWDVSIRTLRRCMHDTYIDCPYYERMQYTMDTMLQILFSYQISSDDRLARKAIYDFHSSLMPDGMITCNWPSKFRQIIPGFSIYWIMMVRDHYLYFNDVGLVKRYLPTIDSILNYFCSKVESETNLVKDSGYWQFVDWTEEWKASFGSPVFEGEHYNVIYNMMFVYGLKTAEWLNTICGRNDAASELNRKASVISCALRKLAWSQEKKMFRDTLYSERYSQHAQIWAVLADIIDGNNAKELMENSMNCNNLAQCSYSMSFFLFRACEKAGLYHSTGILWNKWFQLLKKNLTTWPEDSVSQRSDCHAWGAVPIYEMAACILGVKPLSPGYEGFFIKPGTQYFQKARGKVATKHGAVEILWELKDNYFSLDCKLPVPLKAVVILPDGQETIIENQMEFSIRSFIDSCGLSDAK